MVGQGVCCSVCDSCNKAALVCPACINNTLLYERRKMLMELTERRAALYNKLNNVIAQRQGHVDLELRRQQLAKEAAQARERTRQAEAAVEEAKLEAAALRASNAGRRAAHQRASSELSSRRADHLSRHPTLLRYQALTHSHVSAMLLSEQRAKLAVLLDTLPLRVAAIRSPAAMMAAAQGTTAGAAGAGAFGGGGGTGAGGGGGSGAMAIGGGAAAAAAGGRPAMGAGGAAGAGAAALPGAGGGGSGSGGMSAIQVSLCNFKLPDAASVSALMVQHPEVTSSALGYLLLLTELLSTYLGGPLLHEGSFQGSTSVVWQQHSFWNRRPSSSNARLPLFLEEGAGGAGGGISNPFPGLAAKVRGPGGWGASQPSAGGPQSAAQQPSHAASTSSGPAGAAASAFSALSRAFSGGSSSGAGGAAGGGGGSGTGLSYVQPVDEALLRQRHADLRLAYDMLLRSLACFVRDKVVPLGLQLPPGWGPLGWLAVLCSGLRRDLGTEAVMAAAQQALLLGGEGSGDLRVGSPGGLGTAGGAAAGAAGALGGAGGGWTTAGQVCGGGGGGGGGRGGYGASGRGGLTDGGADHDDDEPVEVEEDGWDVVQAPFLPPPPSQPDEVEQWTRAMFTDATTFLGHGAGGGGAGGAMGGGGGSGALGSGAGGAAAAAGRRLGLGGLGSSLGSLGSSLGALGGGQGGPPSMSLERVRSIFSK